MDSEQHESRFHRLWPIFRKVVTFLLGCAVILDSLAEKNVPSLGKLIVGLLLIGVLPLDDLLMLIRRRERDDAPSSTRESPDDR